MMPESFTLAAIGTLRTCFPEKFATPRQSGLVPAARGVIELVPTMRRAEAWRGIEQHSHLWLITLFHEVPEGQEATTVRPPRLGGNERVGVFATRSPFRPNRLALTVVKLDRVDWDHAEGPQLHVSGVDMVDGTPVLDVKPYVPYADCLPQATSALAQEAPARCEVRWEVPAPDDAALRVLIEQSLSLSPQPAYQSGAREYAATIANTAVRWTQRDGAACIVAWAAAQ